MDTKTWLYTGLIYDKEKIKKCIFDSNVLEIVNPEDTVVLKPNFVQENRDRDKEWDFVITHPAVITAVIELLAEILSEKGKIILADAPMTASSFEKIMSHMPEKEWRELCKDKGIPFEIIDLRDEEWVQSKNHVTLARKRLAGDPSGKVLVNLKDADSEFFCKDNHSNQLYGADYNIDETNRAHNGSDNQYSVSGTVIKADVFINLPKLKSHRKGGITCCLKNLIGINTNKNLLPHHTIGSPQEGGDEFANSNSKTSTESRLSNAAKRFAYKNKLFAPLLIPLKKIALEVYGDNNTTVRNGAWYGNDTLWRTIIDLNKVMFYSNSDGSLKENIHSNKKRYIAIADAIYGGEGDGPMDPDKIECGCLICGNNPVAIDCVAAKIMGFDYRKIPQISKCFEVKNYKLIDSEYEEIMCSVDGKDTLKLADISFKRFSTWKAASGWRGHIEKS